MKAGAFQFTGSLPFFCARFKRCTKIIQKTFDKIQSMYNNDITSCKSLYFYSNTMTFDNIQYQLDMYRFKYDKQAKEKLLNTMTFEEKERFFTFLTLQKYEHLFINEFDFQTI